MFSRDYFQAREKFTDVAKVNSYELKSYVMPDNVGPNGEELSTDVAFHITEKTKRLLIVNSGIHGIEGFYGSAMQSAWLANHPVDQLPEDVGVLMIHASNPHAFAYENRVDASETINSVTHRVDPNRNFIDYSKPLPENPGYLPLERTIIPESYYGIEGYTSTIKLLSLAALDKITGSFNHLFEPLMAGQCDSPNGFSFIGHHPSWTNKVLHKITEECVDPYLDHISDMTFIDLHTGIGKVGDMAIYPIAKPGDAAFDRLCRGLQGIAEPAREGAPYPIRGCGAAEAMQHKYAEKSMISFGIECGTKSSLSSVMALRAQNWLDNYGEPNDPHAAQIKRDIREAFYPEKDTQWQIQITKRTLAAFDGLIKEMRVNGLQALSSVAPLFIRGVQESPGKVLDSAVIESPSPRKLV